MVTCRALKLTLLSIIIMVFYMNETIINPVSVSSALEIADAKNATSYVTTDNKNISLPLAKSLLNKTPPFQEIDIFRLSHNLTTSPNTIVTSYFRIASKHSSTQYDSWMTNFLSLHDHMVIFTQPDLLEPIKLMRNHALDRTVIILMKIEDIPIGKLFSTEFWMDQLERDPEQERHQSYQLFWIWLNKVWCTIEATRLNFFQSDLFLWSDIGCFRDRRYNSKTLILHRDLVPRHEMMHMAHTKPNPPKEDVFDDKFKYLANFYHSGSQFVAYTETWKQFYEYFLDMIDLFLERNMLLVDDQVILQSVCLSHPEICAYVLPSEVNDRRYHGVRFVLHYGGEYNLWRYNKSITN
mmetsp:Transcript_21088/g.45738  ORF Transcript_21088/g.45738 Transcript_21088/m.45738 type:complete len:352 (-) Transcript_21088:473-1528(-)|eukprot:CAMPEP_0172316236 /NCGR_PEP_ID=MMETSP1058-20130122/27565_1 /TAXON_ID=83371 /ORGANISM="Detonula confervacea, Strain CCMP 353" /LENGTH=351 /DNA_ID=CAMNT_0013030505 /DNA_START=198 /DNA_END=1253 /DNA_ORIENTATION=-